MHTHFLPLCVIPFQVQLQLNSFIIHCSLSPQSTEPPRREGGGQRARRRERAGQRGGRRRDGRAGAALLRIQLQLGQELKAELLQTVIVL